MPAVLTETQVGSATLSAIALNHAALVAAQGDPDSFMLLEDGSDYWATEDGQIIVWDSI